MTRMFLFNRRDGEFGDETPAELANQVFFQMWQSRQHPYNVLAEDDVLFLGNTRTREVVWEVRCDRLLTDVPFSSHRQALAALRSEYGLRAADLNGYHHDRAEQGWLMAWSPRPMRRIQVVLPPGQRFGRNGYRELTADNLEEIGLPRRRSREPLAKPPRRDAPTNVSGGVGR